MKLLVIADDLTGALDTGVRFGAKNSLLRIAHAPEKIMDGLPENTQVLIVDSESRHLPPDEAYKTVYTIVSSAKKAGVEHIYKKTDSALRGNIGSELAAARDATGQSVHFVPAFPSMGRVTRGGVHYIGSIPVAESVFGADPFEPVRHSAVADIIAEQTCAHGIYIHDASTEEDMWNIAHMLKSRGGLGLLSGCAGFAAVLPSLLGLEKAEKSAFLPPDKLLTVCGSINPITVSQLDYAENHGMRRIKLTPGEKLAGEWTRSIPAWLKMLETGHLIIDCGHTFSPHEQRRLQEKYGELRPLIADNMGGIATALLDRGAGATMLVTGGDTLLAFMRRAGVSTLSQMTELYPGIVLSAIEYGGREYALISKSGGFGSADLLTKHTEKLRQMNTGGM